MTSSENTNWSTPVLIIAMITIVGGILYFFSDNFSRQPGSRTSQEFDYSGRPVQQMVTPNQIMLIKDEKYSFGKNSLVFKEIDKNFIVIHLYLLDMDAEQAYEKRFLKKDAKKEMVLGGVKYRLLSVNDKFLTLKIISESSKL